MVNHAQKPTGVYALFPPQFKSVKKTQVFRVFQFLF